MESLVNWCSWVLVGIVGRARGQNIAPPPPLPVVEIKTAPVGAEVSALPLVPEMEPEPKAAPIAIAAPREEAIVPVAEAPVGGPLAGLAPARSEADRAAAKRARQARLTRQRKTVAARRAALARANAKQAAASSFNNGFGNSGFGSTLGKQ